MQRLLTSSYTRALDRRCFAQAIIESSEALIGGRDAWAGMNGRRIVRRSISVSLFTWLLAAERNGSRSRRDRGSNAALRV